MKSTGLDGVTVQDINANVRSVTVMAAAYGVYATLQSQLETV